MVRCCSRAWRASEAVRRSAGKGRSGDMRGISYFGAVTSEATHLYSMYSPDVFVPVSACDHRIACMEYTRRGEHCALRMKRNIPLPIMKLVL